MLGRRSNGKSSVPASASVGTYNVDLIFLVEVVFHHGGRLPSCGRSLLCDEGLGFDSRDGIHYSCTIRGRPGRRPRARALNGIIR